MSKPKVIKVFDALEDVVKEAIYNKYPYGFEKYIITFKNHKKHLVSALPFETEDRYYMVKMTRTEANKILSKKEEFVAQMEKEKSKPKKAKAKKTATPKATAVKEKPAKATKAKTSKTKASKTAAKKTAAKK